MTWVVLVAAVGFLVGFACGVAAVLTTAECMTGPPAPHLMGPVSDANPAVVPADLHPAAVYGEYA